MKLFFDLDGTLIDSRQRLYQLFQYLVPESNLSFENYWNFKRNKINHNKILANEFEFAKENIDLFEIDWMKNIELKRWLSLDHPFEGVSEYLNKLKQNHLLFLVTARQSNEMVLDQIKKFKFENLFEKVFVTGQKVEKFDLINKNIKVSKQDWFIGDTGKDIETGKQLGIKTAAVLTGFLNREQLLKYEPDLIVEKIVDLDL